MTSRRAIAGAAAILLPSLWVTGCAFDPQLCGGELGAECGSADAGAGGADVGAPRDVRLAPDADPGDGDASMSGAEEGRCREVEACDPEAKPGDENLLNEMPAGCPRSEFVTLDTTVEGAMCDGDRELLALEIVRCAEEAIEVELVLHTGSDCVADFGLRVAEERYACSSQGVECVISGDGTYRVEFSIAPSRFATPVETIPIELSARVEHPTRYALDVMVRPD